MDLEDVVAQLNERKQRVTYGAVAGVLGVLPRGVMAGRQRNHKNSWLPAIVEPEYVDASPRSSAGFMDSPALRGPATGSETSLKDA